MKHLIFSRTESSKLLDWMGHTARSETYENRGILRHIIVKFQNTRDKGKNPQSYVKN